MQDDGGDTPTQSGTHTAARAASEGYTLTVEDAAAQLGKSVETVRRWIRQSRLPALKVEGQNTLEYRIRPEDLDDAHAVIAAHTATHTTAQAPAHTGDRAAMGVSVDAPTLIAFMESITERLDDQYRALLASRDDTIAAKEAELAATQALAEELRRRAETAELRLAATERGARPRRPWWVRLILGR